MKDWIVRVWLLLIVVCGIFPAEAQDSEAPLGVHPHGSQTHWYPYQCCSGTDCARIKVTIRNDRYVWQSWRWPQFVASVPVDPSLAKHEGTNVHPSQDGDYHGCEIPIRDKFMTITGVKILCFFVPPAI